VDRDDAFCILAVRWNCTLQGRASSRIRHRERFPGKRPSRSGGTPAAWRPVARTRLIADAFSTKDTAMLDLLFIVILLGSFGACLAYTVACERL
jgi:hypothetical protein